METNVIITVENFFERTKAHFEFVEIMPERAPDFVSNSGSFYWHGTDENGDFVIRFANHWVGKMRCKKIKDCIWSISSEDHHHTGFEDIQITKYNKTFNKTVQKRVGGKCYFQDFKYIL